MSSSVSACAALAKANSNLAHSDLLKRHERTCNAKKESEGESLDSPLVPPQNITAGGPSFPTLDHAQLYSYPIASTSTYISPNLPSLSPPSVMDSGSSTESPQTPFGLSPPNEPPMLAPTAPLNAFAASNGAGKEQTLAPVFTRSFSQDEILASEVLEVSNHRAASIRRAHIPRRQDLLRSPPQYGQTPSFMDPNASGMETIGSGSDRPWHGAMATTGASNEAMSVVGSQGWDLFDGGEQGIENSPAARGLADYFNKGGVGGISALDLGFSKDICMFPDHIFDTKIVHHDDDMRFFLPTQKFCLGCKSCRAKLARAEQALPRAKTDCSSPTTADLFPWNVPELDTLSAYGKRAAENFLPSVPLIHPGTLMLSEMPTHTAFALTVAGAAYSAEGEGFSNEMLVEKRVYLVRGELTVEGVGGAG